MPDPEREIRAWAGRGRGDGVEGWTDACRPSFRRARAGAPAQAQEIPCPREERARRQGPPRARGAWPLAARAARFGRGGAPAPHGPAGPELPGARGLSGLRHLPGLERRQGRKRHRDGPRARGRWRRDRLPGRPRPRRPGADPASDDALAAGIGGRGVRDLRRAAARARGPDRGPRPRRASARSCSIPSSSASTGAPWARSSTGRARRCSSGSAPTSSPCCWSSPACCW